MCSTHTVPAVRFSVKAAEATPGIAATLSSISCCTSATARGWRNRASESESVRLDCGGSVNPGRRGVAHQPFGS
jgi:hypothetical protein